MNAAVALCQCCGQPLPPDVPAKWDAASGVFTTSRGSVRLIPQHALFFDALFKSRRRSPIFSAADLMASAYDDDPNGGPMSPVAVPVVLGRIRPLIEPLGWTITRNMGSPRRGFKLVEVSG